jgi:hypothetical protein
MEVKKKIRLFQRFLKELGLCKIYIQDNKICKRDNLRKTVLYLHNNYEENDYDTPSEVINHSLCWADTSHEYLWSTLYDYIELEVENWKDLNKNLEGIVKSIKKDFENNENIDF